MATSVVVPMAWMFKNRRSSIMTSLNNCKSGAWSRNIAIDSNNEATISSSGDAFP